MAFSLSGISTKSLFPLKSLIIPMFKGIFLNHIIYGILMISFAYIFKENTNLFIGFIILAATPPGVAIIPFTAKMNGNLNYSILATFGAFVASIFLSPLIIKIFSGNDSISSFDLFKIMFILIVIPFFVSRLFVLKPIEKTIVKFRGSLIDIGFALIIYTSVGINNHVFYSDFPSLIKVVFVLFVIMFIGSWIIKKLFKNKLNKADIISTQLLFAVKSSGFSVVTAIELFGNKSAFPATVLSVMTLVYLLYQIFVNSGKK
jgi:BASS family bile acid:Na+ symporter